jgi:UDP-N-acetylmuramoylalanine--D-glutamate ligase
LSRFDEFIEVVLNITRKGSICLLSPAAASYDEFRNFEMRGKRFKELVMRMKNEE